MLLQILVPQYKETDEVIKPLLDSIKAQLNVDFNDIGVIITNDGSNVSLSDELIRSYPFTIQYFKNKHAGVSATRNFCLDKATANYVMFCDADDLFINSLGLQLILNTVKNEPSIDFINSTFFEELKTSSGMLYIPKENDGIFVHGKIYNRSFLKVENIRWCDELLIHEDSYFNTLAITLAKTKTYCDSPFYLWHWNDNSVSRNDKYYVIKTYDQLLKSATKLSQELLDRGKKQTAAEMFCLNTFQTFYIMTGAFNQIDELKEVIEKLKPLAAQFYYQFNTLITTLPATKVLSIRATARKAAIDHGWYKETIIFNDWVASLFEGTDVEVKTQKVS